MQAASRTRGRDGPVGAAEVSAWDLWMLPYVLAARPAQVLRGKE